MEDNLQIEPSLLDILDYEIYELMGIEMREKDIDELEGQLFIKALDQTISELASGREASEIDELAKDISEFTQKSTEGAEDEEFFEKMIGKISEKFGKGVEEIEDLLMWIQAGIRRDFAVAYVNDLITKEKDTIQLSKLNGAIELINSFKFEEYLDFIYEYVDYKDLEAYIFKGLEKDKEQKSEYPIAELPAGQINEVKEESVEVVRKNL